MSDINQPSSHPHSTEKPDPVIAAHYASGYEATRLQQDRGKLEEARTRELLLRWLPKPTGVILDVAAGPGAYAVWLTALGYSVHVRDALPLHVDLARLAITAGPGLSYASAEAGDARRVTLPGNSVDAVLLLGPLYHLTREDDRVLALREAYRVVRPGGLVFAVGISRFGSLQDGLRLNLLDDPEFQAIMAEDLRTGQHRNPNEIPGYFTTAYFHRPDELANETRKAGLLVDALLAVEGPAGFVNDFDGWWDDSARRERLLAAIRAVEAEPSLLGASSHLMVVAHKPA